MIGRGDFSISQKHYCVCEIGRIKAIKMRLPNPHTCAMFIIENKRESFCLFKAIILFVVLISKLEGCAPQIMLFP